MLYILAYFSLPVEIYFIFAEKSPFFYFKEFRRCLYISINGTVGLYVYSLGMHLAVTIFSCKNLDDPKMVGLATILNCQTCLNKLGQDSIYNV